MLCKTEIGHEGDLTNSEFKSANIILMSFLHSQDPRRQIHAETRNISPPRQYEETIKTYFYHLKCGVTGFFRTEFVRQGEDERGKITIILEAESPVDETARQISGLHEKLEILRAESQE